MPSEPADIPQVPDPEVLQRAIEESAALLVYFTGPDCAVCEALRPKVAALIAGRFPRLGLLAVDCARWPALAARHRVFQVPTVLAFFEGREWLRRSRGLALAELETALARPYDLLFNGAS